MSDITVYYFTPDCVDVTDAVFDKSIETSPLTVRKSLDGVCCVLKFHLSDIPYSLTNKGYGPYTHAEILGVLAGEAWSDPDAI